MAAPNTEAASAPADDRLPSVLERIADECREIANTLESLQRLAGFLAHSAKPDGEVVQNIQALDRVSQTAAALARALTAIADEDVDFRVDEASVRSAMALESVADRVFPGTGNASHGKSPSDAGTPSFF